MGKFNFTKTIILGTIIAAVIISAGITVAYAGTNIDLKGNTNIDGNLVVAGEISSQSETPTQAGDELFRKVLFYEDTISGGIRMATLDKDLNVISDIIISGELKDTVISGDNLILTEEAFGNVIISKIDLTTGSVIAVESRENAKFVKQIDVVSQPPTTAAFVVLEDECTATGGSCSATLSCSGRLIAGPACVAEDTTGSPLEPFSTFCGCDSVVDPITGDEVAECFGDAFSAPNPVRFIYRGICDEDAPILEP